MHQHTTINCITFAMRKSWAVNFSPRIKTRAIACFRSHRHRNFTIVNFKFHWNIAHLLIADALSHHFWPFASVDVKKIKCGVRFRKRKHWIQLFVSPKTIFNRQIEWFITQCLPAITQQSWMNSNWNQMARFVGSAAIFQCTFSIDRNVIHWCSISGFPSSIITDRDSAQIDWRTINTEIATTRSIRFM